MKRFMSISLILICFLASVFLVSSTQVAEDWQEKISERIVDLSGKTKGQENIPDTVDDIEGIEAASEGNVIHGNTKYIVEEYDMNHDIMVEREEVLPEKYIGMDREAFLDEIEHYSKSPVLSDKNRGLKSVEVESFSSEKIVLRKNYRLAVLEDEFYLCAYDGYIVVYYSDKETVYMYTDILLEGLPESLQEEIIYGKFMDGESELYNFLESYTS